MISGGARPFESFIGEDSCIAAFSATPPRMVRTHRRSCVLLSAGPSTFASQQSIQRGASRWQPTLSERVGVYAGR